MFGVVWATTKPFEASLKNYISLQAATSDRDSNSKQQQTQRNTDSAKREGPAGSARKIKGGEDGEAEGGAEQVATGIVASVALLVAAAAIYSAAKQKYLPHK